MVAAFRADAARAGAVSEVAELAAELCSISTELAAMWRDNDVRIHGEAAKRLRYPTLGPLALKYSTFVVDGRPDLGMIVCNPVNPKDAERIRGDTVIDAGWHLGSDHTVTTVLIARWPSRQDFGLERSFVDFVIVNEVAWYVGTPVR